MGWSLGYRVWGIRNRIQRFWRSKSFPFLACVLCILCMSLAACDESPKVAPSTASAPAGLEAAQVSYNTSMNFSSDGLLRAILHAGRVQTFEAKHETWLDSGVRVDFYNRDGVHSSVLTSQRARVNSMNNDMTAYDHVHIVSDSGTTVDTDSLLWDNKSQTVHSDAPVHIVEKNGRVTDGIGFESDQNLEHYHILHPTILAPSGSLGTQSPGAQNSLRPAQPAIPGAGAMQGAPLGLPVDSARKK